MTPDPDPEDRIFNITFTDNEVITALQRMNPDLFPRGCQVTQHGLLNFEGSGTRITKLMVVLTLRDEEPF